MNFRNIFFNILTALGYVLISFLINNYFSTSTRYGLIWPPSGYAFAIILLFGKKFVPGIFLGAVIGQSIEIEILEKMGFIPLISIILFSSFKAGFAYLGGYFLKKLTDFSTNLNKPYDFFYLGIFGSCSAFLYTSIIILFSYLFNLIDTDKILYESIIFWMGDTLGIILFTPAILIWSKKPISLKKLYNKWEAISCFILAFISCQIIFFGLWKNFVGDYAKDYWMFLFVVWSAVRFGRHGSLLLIMMISLQYMFGILHRKEFLPSHIDNSEAFNYWFYSLALSTVGITLTLSINARREVEEKIRKLALTDALTGLTNRVFFEEQLKFHLNISENNSNKLAILLIDLDKFKPVNDTYGHEAGDIVLIHIGNRLRHSVREKDICSRIGGDEFVILLPKIDSEKEVLTIAERIQNNIKKPIDFQGNTLEVSSCVGISIFPDDGENQIELLKKADLAMYEVKKNGRDGIRIFRG